MFGLRELQNLLSLEEHRHFGRAAEAVGLSQPALSKSLQRLESELGVRLFDRSRSRVVPTEVGQEVIDRARQIVLGVSELRRSVDLLSGVEIGTVSIGIGPAMSESYLAQALARMVDEHPRTRFNVRVDHWQQLLEWLRERELDFYVADIAGIYGEEDLEPIPLPDEEFVWFCRAGHPLAQQGSVSRRDLMRYPIVTPRLAPWAVDWFAEARSGEGMEPTAQPPALQCENYAMLKRIVLSGTSISAALQATIHQELEEGQLIALSVDAPRLTTHAGIVHLRDRTPSPLATRTMETILSCARET